MLEMYDLDAPAAESADCDMETDQAGYTIGETVTISVLAVLNTSPDPGAVEWKAWLEVPAFNPYALVNVGADGSLVLPAGLVFDIGLIPLFVVTAGFPAGTYTLGCRVLDPVTGALLDEDLYNFDIVPPSG